MTLPVTTSPASEPDMRELEYNTFANPRDQVALQKAVDPPVFPLVEALNNLPGITTIGSCCGHFGFFGFGSSPYTYFLAPVPFAERLHKMLETDTRLKLRWSVTPMFHPTAGLAFLLSARRNPLRAYLETADIAWLVTLVQRAASLTPPGVSA